MEELFGYWKEYPPVHILVNAYFEGMGSRTHKKQNLKQADALEEVKRAVVAAGGGLKWGLPDVYRSR